MLGIRAKYNKLLAERKEARAITSELRGCIVELRKKYKDDDPIWPRVADLLERAFKF